MAKDKPAAPAAPAPVEPVPAASVRARYYHAQGQQLIAVPVVVDGTTLRHPDTGDILVTAAQSSPTPADGRYVLD